MKILRLLKIAVINILVLLLGLLLLEVFFGNWTNRDPLTYISVPRNGVWKFEWLHPAQEGAPKFSIYSRDKYGLRGNYGDPENIDLLTVGGSTTDQKYITDGKTWQDVLQNHFRESGRDIRVVNAGMSGRTTYGHIQDFDGWFAHIPGLNPRYYLYYSGINDMFYDAGSPGPDKTWSSKNLSVKETIKRKSALYRVFRTSIGIFLAKKFSLHHSWIDYSKAQWTDTPFNDSYTEMLAPRLENYRQRLQIIADEVAKKNASMIFVTQKRGDYRVVDGKKLGMVNTKSHVGDSFTDERLGVLNPETANGLDYQLILGEFNRVLMEVCEEKKGICLDLASDVEFEIGDFYDHVHNTESGAERIGDYLYSRLSDKIN